MSKPVSNVSGIRAVEAVFPKGCSGREAAGRFGVAPASVVRWCKLRQKHGRFDLLPMGGDCRSRFSKRDGRKVCRWLVKEPLTTIGEIHVRLAGHGLIVSRGAIRRLPVREGFSWRKRTGHANERERDDVRKLRQAWKEVRASLCDRRVIFFEETAFFANMTRLRGWSPIGKRCQGSCPCSHGKTTTLIAAAGPYGIPSSMILDGPLDGAEFRAWVKEVAVRQLRRGDVVVCDNLSVHRISGILDLIEAAGAEPRFLPPYSPDLNPMEKAFSQIKSHLRKVAARTKAKLRRATASVITLVTPEIAVKHCKSCN